ncbi:MAG: flagellar basal-body MS-ring/collar protein FliF [Alphaproteobacteria bacterium]|nr:flagellar basal-body MS-ring/collar protein FliF [Alphaproteobacteria bacterium]
MITFIQALGPSRIAAMGAIAAGLFGFFAFLILQIIEPQMALLFSNLDIRDANIIVNELETRDIPFKLLNKGTTILVPKDNVTRLRMTLAEDNLPSGGTLGYELFDQTNSFGTPSFVQKINRLRALEGELARTIRTIDKIQTARIHLVLPERELFSRDKAMPSASIIIKTRGELSNANIKSIQHLVASAVNGLKPQNISIVNEKGTLLASGSEDDKNSILTSSFGEHRLNLERDLRRQIKRIVTSIVGPNQARVTVTAELEHNRITQTSDLFDPAGQVIRSTQTTEEKRFSSTKEPLQGTTVSNELPSISNATSNAKSQSSNQNDKTQETVNYEISRTTKTEIIEPGSIKKLSVAVLVDGIYSKKENGETAYTPRSKEQIDQIITLVRSTIGYNSKRGDVVEVVNIQFVQPEEKKFPEGNSVTIEWTKEDYFYASELAVLLIITLLVLLFVVRPLVRRIITPESTSPLNNEETQPQQNNQKLTHSLEEGQRTASPQSSQENGVTNSPGTGKSLNKAHGAYLQKIAEILDQNPDEAVSIIKKWLHETA